MTECTSGSCSLNSSGGTQSSSGGTCSCGCGAGCKCGCAIGKCEGKVCEFFPLAIVAHQELLKEKMKKVFEAKIGRKMDQVAEVVANAALVYLKDKMTEKQLSEQYEKKIADIFNG
ncbi:MAG: hypothetical protein WC464_06620 [Bdellovibrionales bacterium]